MFNSTALENILRIRRISKSVLNALKNALTGENKRQIKKRLRKSAKLVLEDKMTRQKFDEKYESWKNHASHGNCHKLIKAMDSFVEELFINGSKNQP